MRQELRLRAFDTSRVSVALRRRGASFVLRFVFGESGASRITAVRVRRRRPGVKVFGHPSLLLVAPERISMIIISMPIPGILLPRLLRGHDRDSGTASAREVSLVHGERQRRRRRKKSSDKIIQPLTVVRG